ncbi:MAG: LamG domain-containing protein [Gammaproteobacteria bacterium]|nr:LamG domain-containing protein [Gammaproteobacteria bacterium]
MMNMIRIKPLLDAITSGALLGILVLGVVACSDSGPTSSQNPDTSTNDTFSYKGPAPISDDVQDFKLNVWDNLVTDDRCGSCHGVDQTPRFVLKDNINTAYQDVIAYVNTADPASSGLVAKVAAGHNCWLADNNVCADIVEGYLTSWLGSSNAAGRQIDLVAPIIKVPGDSKNFPETEYEIDNDPATPLVGSPGDPNSFAIKVYPLLTGVANCDDCHAETSATPQSPFFASNDLAVAYEAAKSKMDLDTPENSRFVLRLDKEFHNCWTTSCTDDAQTMRTAIADFAGAIQTTQIDPQLVTSKALTLEDAIVATGGSRYEVNSIATWEFKSGQSNIAYDTSGKNPAINLTLSGNYAWVLGNGIEILEAVGATPAGKAQASTTASKKLHDLITLTGQYSIEAWVVPGNVTQEMSNIISYSQGDTVRNFTLGQQMYNYEFYNRVDNNSDTDAANGEPMLSTADADEDLQAALQHVVMTYDAVNGRRIYVNGIFTGDMDTVAGDALTSWDDSFALVMGNEVSGNRLWKGKIRLAAVHDRALTQAQIQQNYDVGVGLKYFLLFSVADEIAVPDSYIMFEVTQFDNYSYSFSRPTFINLRDDWVPASDIIIKGLRIGINGKKAVAGQAYGHLDVTINSADYTANGQILSNLGTVIALEKGPDSDEFFLTFEQLAGRTNPHPDPDPAVPAAPSDAAAVSDIGIRTFDEINATMSAVTGVAVTNTAVKSTYTSYKQQLPTVENIEAFLGSHQMAIAQLALTYCSELVDNNGSITRDAFFSGFDFSEVANVAFNSDAKRDAVITPLLTKIMNVDTADSTNNLTTQPEEGAVAAPGSATRGMLGSTTTQTLDVAIAGTDYESIITHMLNQCGRTVPTVYSGSACSSTGRTEEIVKATCASVLGSAVMLIQ